MNEYYLEAFSSDKVLRRTVYIPNLDAKVCTQENYFTQGNYLHSLMHAPITRQIPFKHTDIEYDIKKDEITRIEYVYYNTDIGQNIMNKYDIQDFVSIYLN